MRYKVGTCAICVKDGVSSKHYNSFHNIRIRNYFFPFRRYTPPDLQPLTCRKCDGKVWGSHEAVKHLKEKHPELISQNVAEREVAKMTPEADKTKEDEKTESIELEAAMANATIGGVFDFLIDQRRKAEAETECVKILLRTEQGKLAGAMARIRELESDKKELKEASMKLEDETARLAKDNRDMNNKMLALRNGARITQERADIYSEYTKK